MGFSYIAPPIKAHEHSTAGGDGGELSLASTTVEGIPLVAFL